MISKDLELLPPELAARSISDEEIVLRQAEALRAIDILESKGVLILGWEGWVKTKLGDVGHGGPQGTESLGALSVEEAAAFCRATIWEEAALWTVDNPGRTDELHFCITIDAEGEVARRRRHA
jgi:hypothetical protein